MHTEKETNIVLHYNKNKLQTRKGTLYDKILTLKINVKLNLKINRNKSYPGMSWLQNVNDQSETQFSDDRYSDGTLVKS